MPFWLSAKEERIEVDNILNGNPTFKEIPCQKQFNLKLKPPKN